MDVKLQKVKASMMNAVHDLPLLVARDEGFFRDEGLDVSHRTNRGYCDALAHSVSVGLGMRRASYPSRVWSG